MHSWSSSPPRYGGRATSEAAQHLGAIVAEGTARITRALWNHSRDKVGDAAKDAYSKLLGVFDRLKKRGGGRSQGLTRKDGIDAMERLETERLILRMFRDSDFDAYAEMCGDTEVMKYLGGPTMTRSEAWRSMAMVVGHWQLRGFGLWAVEERRAGCLVGRVGCWRPEGWPGLEIAWTLRRAFWGQGYATEAARAALDVAFSQLARAPRHQHD